MRILFLDQSGKLGGAELSLLDLADFYKNDCLVGLFQDGPFRDRLEAQNIPVRVLAQGPLQVQKSSSFIQSLFGSATRLLPLVWQVLQLSRQYDLIYSNTQKAFVVGALAKAIARKPLIHHQRDILSTDHFSLTNLRLAVFLANHFTDLIIANSKATRAAFIAAGGKPELCQVVYNGFDPQQYLTEAEQCQQLRETLGIADQQFVIGHFSRLSPWKGQHILLEALATCPSHFIVLLVGEALFGEEEYVIQLKQQIEQLDLQTRVKLLGFRSDIPTLMTICDVVVHSSTAPEPFGRVIIEAMLCGKPVIAAAAGGAVELIEPGITGWLTQPSNVAELSQALQQCQAELSKTQRMAETGRKKAQMLFSLSQTQKAIQTLLKQRFKPL